MLRKLPSAAKSLCSALSGPDRGPTLRAIVDRTRVEPGLLSVTLCPIAMAERLGIPPAQISRSALSLVGEFMLRRRGIEAKLVLANAPSALDPTLIKTVALGWVWFVEIKAGATMQAIANREGVIQRRVAHLVDLAFLAPDIVRSIVEGRQPPTLTADSLIKSRHRMLWSGQRAWILGSETPLFFGGEFPVIGRTRSVLTTNKIPVKCLRQIIDKPLSGRTELRENFARNAENQLTSLLISLLAGKPSRKIAERRPRHRGSARRAAGPAPRSWRQLIATKYGPASAIFKIVLSLCSRRRSEGQTRACCPGRTSLPCRRVSSRDNAAGQPDTLLLPKADKPISSTA